MPVETKTLFNQSLKDFEGTEIPNSIVKKVLLSVVGAYKAKTGDDSIKSFALGVNIANDVNLKSEEIVLLKNILSDNTELTTIAKGQILNLIKDL